MEEIKSKGMGPVAWTAIICGAGIVVLLMLGQGGVIKPTEQPVATPIDLNDGDALAHEYGSRANAGCSSQADAYLRQVTKYALKWDDMGTFDTKFDQYLVKVPKPGVIVMTSNKIAVQNGFGAYQRIDLRCSFDTQTKEVLGFQIMDQ